MTNAKTSVRIGYRPSPGSETLRISFISTRAPITPIARPTVIEIAKSATTAPERGVSLSRVEDRDHQRDPDRVVRAGLALEDRSRAPADLAVAEHREHHRRVGGRDRGAEDPRRRPAEVEEVVPGDRDQRRRCERADDPERGDRHAALLKRFQPTCIPPSNRISTSATTPIRSRRFQAQSGGRPRDRDQGPDQQEERRAGIGNRSVSLITASASEESPSDDEHDRPEGQDLVHVPEA